MLDSDEQDPRNTAHVSATTMIEWKRNEETRVLNMVVMMW